MTQEKETRDTMCDYWYEKGREETKQEFKRIIEGINYCDGGKDCKCKTDMEKNINVGKEAVVMDILKAIDNL